MRTWVVPQPYSQVWAKLNTELQQRGFWLLPTFDLRSVGDGMEPLALCPCHGATGCTCQVQVVLVYGASGVPATILLHGQNEVTELTIEDTGGLLGNPPLHSV